MSQAPTPILWLVYRVRHEGGHANKRNAVIVLAASPGEARAKAEETAPSGEKYQRPNYRVVSLNTVMDRVRGVLPIVGEALAPGCTLSGHAVPEDFTAREREVFCF